LFISLVNGQTSALLLLGVLVWYYGLSQNSNRTAGLGLALAVISPQIALVLAIPFIFHAPRRKVWWWFCLGGAILAVLSMAMLGRIGVQNFINALSLSASGEGYHTNEIAMYNLIGLVKRFPLSLDAADIRMIGWVGSLVGLIILCWLWGRTVSITDKYISLAVITAIFTSPHLHYHDLALLIIPIFVGIRSLVAAGKTPLEFASLMPLCISLMFILIYSIPQLNYAIVYLAELVLLIIPWRFKNKKEITQPPIS
jgi:hypothetical protein